MELSLDTSTAFTSLALSQEGKVIAELTWKTGRNQTAETMPGLLSLLRLAEVDRRSIEGVILARGPGSFNGLRAGMSLAKGLAFSLGIPLVSISTLEVAAYPYAATRLPICSMLNAGRGEIAAAIYQSLRGRWRRLVEEHITDPEGLISSIHGRTLFCGEIPEPVAAKISGSLGSSAIIIGGAAGVRRAAYLAELGWRRLQAGDFDHIPTLQPLYLRKPAITLSSKIRTCEA
ncbi:MAG: tRNA (adenosine(37)-N6)-threonylcarbamoyltransferase complex dimerization subunit type 1 TsaB [Dehalococcoidia bacterium]|nr:tRNA (adenosine(37)-N6)-threonylcarbamoyltransferase complex dimerization subunit type 1 TsaB [Dehalococcoidia bacterium]